MVLGADREERSASSSTRDCRGPRFIRCHRSQPARPELISEAVLTNTMNTEGTWHHSTECSSMKATMLDTGFHLQFNLHKVSRFQKSDSFARSKEKAKSLRLCFLCAFFVFRTGRFQAIVTRRRGRLHGRHSAQSADLLRSEAPSTGPVPGSGSAPRRTPARRRLRTETCPLNSPTAAPRPRRPRRIGFSGNVRS